jgi:transmembrane sensor
MSDHDTDRLDKLLARRASRWVEDMRDATPQQRSAFVAWLKESPANVRNFLLMSMIDQSLEAVDPERSHDVESLLATVDPTIVELPRLPARPTPKNPRRTRWAISIVAAAACVLGGSVIAWFSMNHREPEWRVFETAIGEQRAFELEDGSLIHLNTHSRAAIHFSAHAREVRLLDGEALFRVQHDSSRPFRVYTNDAVIQAVGTQFNVYERPQGTSVAVIEGRVNIQPATAATTLAATPRAEALSAVAQLPTSPGRIVHSSEEAEITHQGEVSVRAAPDVTDAVAWQKRRLVFRQQTLEFIAAEFNRYSRKQIRVESPAVANRVYTGVFDADDVDSFAQALASDPRVDVQSTAQTIVITSR